MLKNFKMLVFERDIKPFLELGADDKPNAKLLHSFYEASILHRNRLAEVFAKKMPSYLNINRPKEREEYKKYREAIYRNPMRSFRRRVVEALDNVRQADDFDVVYPKQLEENTTKKDSLESLLANRNYTKDGDIVDWFFGKVRAEYIDDPNAVVVMLPLLQPISDNERVKPEPQLIPCQNVYQFRKGEFAVLESMQKSWILNEDGKQSKTGKILIFIDADSYSIATQKAKAKVSGENKLTYIWEVTGLSDLVNEAGEKVGLSFAPPRHNCPTMPARKIGKLVEKKSEEKTATGYITKSGTDQGEEFFESLVTDALPHVEGVQEVGSDIQVERNFHISSQEWRYAQKLCPDAGQGGLGGRCINGQVHLLDDKDMPIPGKTVPCPKCKGTGMDQSGSGLGLIIVSAPTANNLSEEGRPTNLPIPPGGFIPRPIEALQEFVKEFDRERRGAYETVNMQFLMDTPQEQSGTAKRMDREELYKTLIVNGAHLCGLLQFLCECAAFERFQEAEAPKVLAPVRLSIENSELTRQELAEAVDKHFDPNLRKPLEKKLIEYQAGKDSDYYVRYELRERLDPFSDASNEAKLFLLSGARITQNVDSEEYRQFAAMIWMSINFDNLISAQLRKGDGFLLKDQQAQYDTLIDDAKKLMSPAKPVSIDPKTGLPTLLEGQLAPIVDVKNVNQLN